jgi:hypothetical protein
MLGAARHPLVPRLCLAALLALAWGGVSAQQSPDSARALAPSSVPPAPDESSATQEARVFPAPVFASFERAWMVGNADSVLEHFGKRKVYISLPDGGPDGGLFSRAQSYFILKGFFDATRTEEFSFVSIRQLEDPPGTAVGRAERTFRKRDSSRLLQDRLFVSLVHENDHWVVAEIKSVR